MSTVLRYRTAMAVCAVLLGWSAPLAGGSEAHASDPSTPPVPPSTNSTSYSRYPGDFSLTVSPTRLVLTQAEAGTPATVLVVNQGAAPARVAAQKRNFTAGTDGAMLFQEDAPYAASAWVTLSPASFELAPGTSQVVTATVTVPAEPEPGDHQVAVVFVVPAGATDANIKINRGVAVPLYVAVDGPTDNSAVLDSLSAPSFVMTGGVDVTAKVRNTGTVHRDFRATNPLTFTAADSKHSFPDFTVLRGGVRDVTTVWEPPLICVCHPTVSITNADGSVATTSVRVIVFPVHLLAILIVALVLGVLALRWWRRRELPAISLTVRPPLPGAHV